MHYAHKVDSGEKVRLDKIDPSDHAGLSEEEARAMHAEYGKTLEHLQSLMYAAGQGAVLVVLQGLDTSGKDGTIRSLMGCLNPQVCKVASFKVPTQLELSHDFLWRVHAVTPQRGTISIFNRSHYEDVLVARVHKLVEKDVWKRRYEHINCFESLLAESGVTILKFLLHISKDEQEQRLLDREKDAEKAYKLSVGDWKEREHWDDYVKAYEDALSKCSTKEAPWYIVPANHKWYRDLAVIQRLVEAMEKGHDQWQDHLRDIGTTARAEIDTYRAAQKPK